MTLSAFALSVAMAVSAPVAPAPTSEPTPFNGQCDVGEFCLYYNSSAYGFGSLRDYPYGDSFLGDDRFVSAGGGRGQTVKNNAAAFWNRTSGNVYVYTLENYHGITGTIGPGLGRRDFSLGYKNQVESFLCSACNWS